MVSLDYCMELVVEPQPRSTEHSEALWSRISVRRTKMHNVSRKSSIILFSLSQFLRELAMLRRYGLSTKPPGLTED